MTPLEQSSSTLTWTREPNDVSINPWTSNVEQQSFSGLVFGPIERVTTPIVEEAVPGEGADWSLSQIWASGKRDPNGQTCDDVTADRLPTPQKDSKLSAPLSRRRHSTSQCSTFDQHDNEDTTKAPPNGHVFHLNCAQPGPRLGKAFASSAAESEIGVSTTFAVEGKTALFESSSAASEEETPRGYQSLQPGMAMDSRTAFENIATITKGCSLLSHSFFDICAGLVDSNITPALTAIAHEFAELADLSKHFGEILTIVKNTPHVDATQKLLDDAGGTLSRLDEVRRCYEQELQGFNPRQTASRRFERRFRTENISDFTYLCRSVKDPLHMMISTLKIALEQQQQQQRRKKSKQRKTQQDVTAITRECELAESWVEGSRHVIQALLSAEGLLQKGQRKEIYTSTYWTESLGDTASWMYNVIFNRAFQSLPASQRYEPKGGRVRTVRTADGNATASDSEREEVHKISDSLKRELAVLTGVKEMVVDELLNTWTGIDPRPVRLLTDSTRSKDKNRNKVFVDRIIKHFVNNDNVDGENANITQDEIDPRRWSNNTSPPPAVPSAPSSLINEPTEPSKNVDGAPVIPETAKERKNSPSRKDRIKKTVPFITGDNIISTQDSERSFTVHIVPEPQSSSSRKPTTSKEPANRDTRPTAPKAYHNPRVNFEEERQRRPERARTDSSQRVRSRSANNLVGHGAVPGDEYGWDRQLRLSSHPSQAPSARGNAFPNPYVNGPGFVPNPSSHLAPIRNPVSSASGHTGKTPPYYSHVSTTQSYEQANILASQMASKLEESQQRVKELENEKKALEASLKDQEKAQREEARRKTLEEDHRRAEQRREKEDQRKELEEHRAKAEERGRQVQRLQRELRDLDEEMQRVLGDIKKSKRRQEEIFNEERAEMERKLKELKSSNDEFSKVIETVGKSDITTESEISEDLRQSEHQAFMDWMKERGAIIEEADGKLQQAVSQAELKKQAAIEAVVGEYSKKLVAEEEKARLAEVKAEYYETRYNACYTAWEESKTQSTTSTSASTRTHAPVDPFDYIDKHQNSTIVSDSVDDASCSERPSGTVHLDTQNPWAGAGGSPYDGYYHRGRIRQENASNISRFSDESSNVIVFPPHVGSSEFGHNQLGNYLSRSGFKAMFEERERPPGRLEKVGSGGNVLRGTLFWQPPASTADADLYKSLRNCGWRPTYRRSTDLGQTWFFGAQPVHALFFNEMYKPQVSPLDLHGSYGTENDLLIINKDLVETNELELLGHEYREVKGEIYLDPSLTPEDIDHIVARSFLAREGQYRKRFRKSRTRFSSSKFEISEVASESGDNISEVPLANKDNRLSLWPLWGSWSSRQ